jgi:hypothetical protein
MCINKKHMSAENNIFLAEALPIVRQIEGKNLLYRGTIPFCLHIVP